MLNIINLTDNFDITKGTAMLLGGFDGLHVGHRQLLSRAKESGLPVGIMTIFGGKGEKNLFTFTERKDIFQRSGVDFVVELPFSKIKDLSPQAFLSLLEENCYPKLFVCGEDFRFGAGAKGTPETIKEIGHVRVEMQSLLEIDGEKISSTTVKKQIVNGNVEKANRLLGEEFFLCGSVKKDRQIGRTIGFPTANIAYPQDKFPLKEGVYATKISVSGKEYNGVTNYGARPTFSNNEVLTETYLDGFAGDLYGKTLTVRFVRYLREVIKFDSVDALKTQLQKDVEYIKLLK